MAETAVSGALLSLSQEVTGLLGKKKPQHTPHYRQQGTHGQLQKLGTVAWGQWLPLHHGVAGKSEASVVCYSVWVVLGSLQ